MTVLASSALLSDELSSAGPFRFNEARHNGIIPWISLPGQVMPWLLRIPLPGSPNSN